MPARRKGNDFEYTEISTKKNLWFRYGVLEIRAKLNETPATSAFWLNSDYYGVRPEVDLLEDFGRTTTFSTNIHKWFSQPSWDGTTTWAHTSLDGSAHNNDRRFKYDTDKYKDTLADDYHIYSLEWTENHFRFAFDGITYFTYDFSKNPEESDALRQKLYLLLSTTLGSASYYSVRYDPEIHGTEFDLAIDYVRIYQRPATDELDFDFYR